MEILYIEICLNARVEGIILLNHRRNSHRMTLLVQTIHASSLRPHTTLVMISGRSWCCCLYAKVSPAQSAHIYFVSFQVYFDCCCLLFFIFFSRFSSYLFVYDRNIITSSSATKPWTTAKLIYQQWRASHHFASAQCTNATMELNYLVVKKISSGRAWDI